jgi:hypothetical protein
MSRTCTLCPHLHRDDIERRLLEGAPLRNIAKQFSLSSASLFRHNKHISKTLSHARQEAEILRADGLIEKGNRNATTESAGSRRRDLEREWTAPYLGRTCLLGWTIRPESGEVKLLFLK